MKPAMREVGFVLALALAAPFCLLSRPLTEVDDARYAEVPRAMAASGDWLTPRLNGFAYVEKPPLWYWLAAASYEAFGVSESSARLPLAVLALLGAAGVWWLASWLWPGAGASSALVFSTCASFLVLSRFITPDMPLAVALLWCTAMILRTLARPQDGWWAGPSAWAFAGLAFLCKGLVALMFPAAWTAALLVLFPPLRRGWKGLLRPAGPALFALIVGPWLLETENRHPGFVRFFFVEQHFQRFLTPKYNRPGAWYYFIPVLAAGLLPWTPLAASGLADAWQDGTREGGREGSWKRPALALWALGVLAFFSVSRSKLATYVFPAFPHLCILAAQAGAARPRPWVVRFAAALGAALLAAAALPLVLPQARALVPVPAAVLAAAALAALGLGTIAAAFPPGGNAPGSADREGRAGAGSVPVAASLALAALAAGLGAAALSEPLLSARQVGLAVAAAAKPDDLVYCYGTFLHGLPFYAKRPVDRMIYWVGELHYARRDPANADRFGDDNAIRALPLRGRTAFVVLRGSEAAYFRTLVKPEHLRGFKPYGRWVLATVAY